MEENIKKSESAVNNEVTINEIRQRAFISVQELSQILGLGLTYTYEFIKSEECQFNVLKAGKRYIIPANSFLAWYDNLK